MLMKHNAKCRVSRTDFLTSPSSLRLFFVFFERERKAGAVLLSLIDAVWSTSGVGKQRFMEEPPPRAEGEKGLPLWPELDIKSGGRVGGARQPLGLARR